MPNQKTQEESENLNLDPGVVAAAIRRKAIEGRDLPESLGDFLRSAVTDAPDDLVVNFFQDDVQLTYRQAHDKSDRLADALMQRGVRKGSHVAVMIPNSEPYFVTWFAIAKIGAVIVPINFGYQPPELNYVLRDSDAQFLMIDEACLPILEALDEIPPLLAEGGIFVVGAGGNDQWPRYASMCEDGRAPFTAPEPVGLTDLFGIQYTSGTTGLPKGCMLSHRYWLTMARVASEMSGKTFKNILTTFPMFYVDPQIQFLMTIHFRGTAFIARRHSLSQFKSWLKTYNIHTVSLTPPAAGGIVEEPGDGDNDLRYISAFYFKGQDHIDLEQRFKTVARDAFGMTEVGVATYTPVEATHMVGKNTVGIAAPFREVKVCDEAGAEVAHGESGELCIKGPGMLWGYYKKPEANRNSFREDWFRSGDLATMDEKGYVRIVGRLKEMIKRSGENIAAQEVEAVLCEIPTVLEAAVVAVPDDKRMEEVKAYLILKDGASQDDITPAQIVEHCKGRLAAFKIPRYFAYVNDVPRTPSNKVAKNRLIENVEDLRVGAYDRVKDLWRQEAS